MSQTMSMSARTPSIHELHHESASTSALPSPKLVPAPSQEDKQKNALADIKRRKRTTPEALAVLSVAFAENPLPNLQKRKALAEQLSMDTRAVQIWFQNRRQKEKKLPEHERIHKDLPTQQQRKSLSRSHSSSVLSVSSDPAHSDRNTDYDSSEESQRPAKKPKSASNSSSSAMLQPPPHIHRTLSEPVIRSFSRAESVPVLEHGKPERPAIKRSASTFSLSTDIHTGRVSTRETQDDLSLHMPTSSPTQGDDSYSSSRPRRSSAIARPGPLLRRTSSVIFAPDVKMEQDPQSFCPPPSSDDLEPTSQETDASVPKKIADGEHSPGSDARSALQRKRQRMHQRAREREMDPSSVKNYSSLHNYNLNLKIPSTNPFDMSAAASDSEPLSACSSTGGLSELLRAATTSTSSPGDTTQQGGPSGSQSSIEFDTDSDVVRDAQSRGGDQTYSSIASSPEEDADMRPAMQAFTKPSAPALIKPTIITTSENGTDEGPEAESECAQLLLNLSGFS